MEGEGAPPYPFSRPPGWSCTARPHTCWGDMLPTSLVGDHGIILAWGQGACHHQGMRRWVAARIKRRRLGLLSADWCVL